LIDKFTGKEGLFENSPFDEPRQIVAKQNATRDFDRQRVSGYRSYTNFQIR
jgi:hypothetical protein